MSLTTYLVVDVSYVSGRYKKTLKKASASNGSKTKQAGCQGEHTDKAGRLIRKLGLLALFWACLLCYVLLLAPENTDHRLAFPAGALVLLKWLFFKPICVD